MRAALGALVLLVAGCSLPLPDGVQVSRDAPAFDSPPGDIQVMPPGPQPDAAPDAIVRGFLGAESSPEANYQVARKFLTPRARWINDEVQVYDPATLTVTSPPSASLAVVVSVTFDQLGLIDREGRYASVPRTRVTETYPLKQDAQRQWRIEDPPRGVRVTPADRDRSYPPRRIYFLSQTPRASLHVVPDQVLLPVGGDPARAELTRLVAGPSSAIADSVTTGFPEGTRLVSVSQASGVYDVAFSRQVVAATDLQRQSLSAQVVWTLRGLDPRFRGVRITAGSRPLDVSGVGEVQGRDDWDVFDPEGLAAGPAYFVAGNRVQSLTGGRRGAGPPVTRDLPVQSVAVSPDRSQVAVINGGVVRRGPIDGRALPVAWTSPDRRVSSPSWGTGDRGLWLLTGRGQVVLIDSTNRVRPVRVPGVEGRISWIATSRDGVRSALVINGALYVGRVTPAGTPLAIVGATRIAPEISGVTRVAWRDPTTLVVLGTLSQTPVPVLVAVDGSSVRPIPAAGLPAGAQEVAASSLGVVVTSAGRLFQLSNLGFRPGPSGRAPAYPG